MDTNPSVTSASSCGSVPPVVSAAVATAAAVSTKVATPTAVPNVGAYANAALDTAVVGSASAQAGEASLRTALDPVPSAAAPGAASASSGTESGSDTDHIVGRGTGSSSEGTKVYRYHKYQRCIRGVKCKYRHPITCQNLTVFGVCKDRKCNRT